MTEYSNQADIDELQRKLFEVSPTLKLNHFVSCGGVSYACCTGVTVPLKGNKKLIDKLVLMGFRKGHKRGVSKYNGFGCRQSLHYLIDMDFYLPKPAEEEGP